MNSVHEQASARAVMAAGLTVSVLGAAANALYFFAYGAVTGRVFAQTGLGSVVMSSALPPPLAAGAAVVLSRLTRHAPAVFSVVTLAITAASLTPFFSSTLPDGTAKPEGFDGLVLPMHVVVGGLAAWLITRALRVRR